MPQSLSRMYVHIVFSTKYRESLIHPMRKIRLHQYMAETCRRIQVEAIRVGGTENHIHLAVKLPQTKTIAKVVEVVKSASSKWMKTGEHCSPDFQWQEGYGAFSVSDFHLPVVCEYIERQEEHHRKLSYEDEIREMSGTRE